MQQPKKRSQLRKFLGIQYYTLRRNIEWALFRPYKLTKKQHLLPYNIYTDSSILQRALPQVDMWMQTNKRQNLQLAINQLDRIVLKPGNTLSFWKHIGKPTKGKGYLHGMYLSDGAIKTGVGGGLCQLSNLLYWITLHTPLTIVERWRHSYDVFPDVSRTRPFGSGATCSYPNIDLKIKNTTHHTYQLHVWLTDTHLHAAWYSENTHDYTYHIYESTHSITHEVWGGYSRHNTLTRTIFDKHTKELVKEEIITKNSAIMMYEPLLVEKSRK